MALRSVVLGSKSLKWRDRTKTEKFNAELPGYVGQSGQARYAASRCNREPKDHALE